MIWLIVPVLIIALIAFIRRDKSRERGSGQLGTALQNLEGLFIESKKHVIEVKRETRAEEDDSGDPPAK